MLKLTLFFLLFIYGLTVHSASLFSSGSNDKASSFDDEKAVRPPPAVTFSKNYKGLNVQKAYELQKAFVQNSIVKGIEISGFKAGLMREGAAEKFGLEEPVTGVLLHAPLQGDKFTLSESSTYQLLLEQEVAYKLNQDISSFVDAKTVRSMVSSVAPALELPDLSFNSKDFNGLDIIANNAIAYRVIIGDWKRLNRLNIDLNTLVVSLSCGDELIDSGIGRYVLGGQWQALAWMVNNLIQQGYIVKQGQILVTGNMLSMHGAKACHYIADYGELGVIELTIL